MPVDDECGDHKLEVQVAVARNSNLFGLVWLQAPLGDAINYCESGVCFLQDAILHHPMSRPPMPAASDQLVRRGAEMPYALCNHDRYVGCACGLASIEVSHST